MFSATDRKELAHFLATQLVQPVQLVLCTGRGSGDHHPAKPWVAEARDFLKSFGKLHPGIQCHEVNLDEQPELRETYRMRWAPAFALLDAQGQFYGQRQVGLPLGYEMAAFLESVIDLSGQRTELERHTRDSLGMLSVPIHLMVFSTPGCPYCPIAAHLAHQLALWGPTVEADTINALEFPDLAQSYGVQAVPTWVMNGQIIGTGALSERLLLQHLLQAEAAHQQRVAIRRG